MLGKSDEVFIAINANRDGHDFIEEAIKMGVRNFIIEDEGRALESVNTFYVKNTIRAFQQISSNHRNSFHIPLVGITGSNGKTTVKEWLSTILSEKYFVVKNPKSYNSQIGVPLSVLSLRSNHEVGVFEAGISQPDEMTHLEPIIRPTIGIFTTLGEAHDDGFDSKKEKLQEKLKLFARADQVIYRSDREYSDGITHSIKSNKCTWSLDETGKFKVQWNPGSISVNNKKFRVAFSNITEFENVTHSIIGSLLLDLSHEQIQRGLDLLTSIPMRLEFKKGINGSYILDDSYNNDLAGLKVALNYLETHKENNKRALILSDITQSGIPDHELYEEVNKLLLEKRVDRLIGVGPRISEAKKIFDISSEFFNTTDELLNDPPPFDSEMILIKGARDFRLERVSKLLQERIHGTVLEVNFDALQYNLNQYRNLLKQSTKMMVMVKANAYGSGILEVANFLQHQRIDQLGVAYLDEAVALRKNGITLPIMIMNPFIDSFREFENYDLQAEIFSLNHLTRLLKDTDGKMSIQVKIDTGMHRLGFDPDELKRLIEVLKRNKRITVAGIFTHFSSSDSKKDDDFTIRQAQTFDKAYDELSSALGYAPTKHACNSPAMVRWPQYHYDMVRLGIGLHGFDPTHNLKLRKVSTLKTIVSQIQMIKEGATVGYSRKGVLQRDSRIAVLPLGYEDGYTRVFGNGNAKVLIDGKLCPIVGNVCMDMIMVDVTDTNAQEGDEVIVFGENPSIEDLALWSNTIPYEVLTNVSSRVKRVFIWE